MLRLQLFVANEDGPEVAFYEKEVSPTKSDIIGTMLEVFEMVPASEVTVIRLGVEQSAVREFERVHA